MLFAIMQERTSTFSILHPLYCVDSRPTASGFWWPCPFGYIRHTVERQPPAQHLEPCETAAPVLLRIQEYVTKRKHSRHCRHVNATRCQVLAVASGTPTINRILSNPVYLACIGGDFATRELLQEKRFSDRGKGSRRSEQPQRTYRSP